MNQAFKILLYQFHTQVIKSQKAGSKFWTQDSQQPKEALKRLEQNEKGITMVVMMTSGA